VACEHGESEPAVEIQADEDPEASATEESEEQDSIASYMERLLGRSSVRRRKSPTLPAEPGPTAAGHEDELSAEFAPEAMEQTHELIVDTSTLTGSAAGAEANGDAVSEPAADTESPSEPEVDVDAPGMSEDQLRHGTPEVPKDVLRANLDSFRELANMSARTAVAQHASKRLWSTIQLKVAVTGVGLAVTATLIAAEVMGIGTFLVWTTIAGLITFGALVELVRTLISYFRWQSIEEGGNWSEHDSHGEPGALQELEPADD
jgi:hypothetical protein